MNLIHVAVLVACANEIYLYVAALSKDNSLSKEDKKEIKNKHLKKLIELGIIYFSIATNNIKLLIYLLENNFITNNQALIIASSNCHVKVIKYLINHGAATSSHSGDDYALTNASGYGHLEVVEYLVDHGAATSSNSRDDLSLLGD